MDDKSLRTNKLTHLFETVLQQEEQERQQEQEQEEQELELEREQAQRSDRRMVPNSSLRFSVGEKMSFDRKPFGTARKRIVNRENIRFAAHHVPSSGRSDDESARGKNAGLNEWSAEAVSYLLECYALKYASGRGYLRNSDWEEVLCTVNAREGFRDLKTMKQCRDKVDSLKKRYRVEKKKAMNSGSSVVLWPLFSKLDEMMSCQSRVARIPGGVDAGVKLPFSEPNHSDPFRAGPEQLDSPGELAADLNLYDLPFRKKGKMAMDETDGLSEEDFNSSPCQRQEKHSSRTGSQESLDEGSRSKKGSKQPGISGKCFPKKRKAKLVDPIQTLADAVVGFSDVFARIEMAKMEIFTKMTLELAKLERKNRSSSSSSSSSSSETE